MQAPTSKPPLLPPSMASKSRDVYLLSTRYCAAAMKSSNTFCFFVFTPCKCHSSPYSPPPRRLGTANKPPFSRRIRVEVLNQGVRLTLNPPYPYNRQGFLPFI